MARTMRLRQAKAMANSVWESIKRRKGFDSHRLTAKRIDSLHQEEPALKSALGINTKRPNETISHNDIGHMFLVEHIVGELRQKIKLNAGEEYVLR